jgi:type IV pilus assembly protein PilB
MSKRLGELLLEQNVITKEQLLDCLKYQKAYGVRLGPALVSTKAIADEDVLADFMSKAIESGILTIPELDLDPAIVQLVPPDIAQKFKIIAINKTARLLAVAISDPKNLFVLDAVKFLTGCSIKPVVTTEQQILQAIRANYKVESPTDTSFMDDLKGENLELVEDADDEDDISAAVADAPVVKLVNHLLTEAVAKGASDIHIETYQKILRVRYRIDGTLMELAPLPFRLRPAIISRIKIMSNLNISEKRLPQDGRIKIKIGMNSVDIRVSTVPTVYGEKVVMRVLDTSNLVLDIKKLGIPEPGAGHVMTTLGSPFGMLLVTGPTGSGKTTTLYSALSMLNKPDTNIMTAEDPVEYNVDGVNQVLVNSAIGLTFASALRAFLRQDPDVIMVGEIRDLETAEIAVKAALTGHLVFSTLHTNNSVATIARMIDMGLEPFLIASSVRTIVAQRLVRKICTGCKTLVDGDPIEIAKILRVDPGVAQGIKLYKGKGCQRCNNTGYKGRAGLYEVLPITTTIQDLIVKRATSNELVAAAAAEGMRTLRMCGIEKLTAGITTLEEVIATSE